MPEVLQSSVSHLGPRYMHAPLYSCATIVRRAAAEVNKTAHIHWLLSIHIKFGATAIWSCNSTLHVEDEKHMPNGVTALEFV